MPEQTTGADFGRVAVIGSGVMGAAIAAHVANAGVPVLLLDIVPPDAEDRNVLARGAVARMLKTNPAPFMTPEAAELITPGNLDDDLGALADVDWICEAVIENLDIKRALYRRLDAARRPGSIVSSNTSTIPLHKLVEGQSDAFRRDFAVTHFFNPPRYMRLLELVGGADTRADALATLRRFCDVRLGKDVVACRDTPGFIANRIGIYWVTVAMSEALAMGLSVEDADAIVGKPMGIPKTGIFGLADLTGIDLSPHASRSMAALLPKSDPFHAVYDEKGPLATLIGAMIAEGNTGRKGKGGFYRMRRNGGDRVKEARELATGTYRLSVKSELESARSRSLRALVSHPDKGGQYAWRVLSKTLAYAASLLGDAADSIDSVDRAMRTGYAWDVGPFEQIDRLGAAWLRERLGADGIPVPPLLVAAGDRPLYRENGAYREAMRLDGSYAPIVPADGAWRLADFKRGKQPIASNASASLWDIGDGVACLEFHSKMNSVDPLIVAMVREAAKVDKRGFKALVVANDAVNFSVGANIGLALFVANAAMWPVVEQNTKEGQDAYMGLKYAPFPVVGAPSGMALGGGCEILLHCDAVQAHAESYIGLVEVGVGIVPAWGGSKEMVLRNLANPKRPGGPMPAVANAFETIALAKVSRSAAEAKKLLYLRPGDGITMNRDRVLCDAKARALGLAAGYRPPAKPEVALPGPTGRVALELAVDTLAKSGKATAHDAVVTRALARVLSGGDTDITVTIGEKELLALEREAALQLLRTSATLDRIEHMLETGKPLRN